VHIRKTLADLIAQRAQIDRAISALEAVLPLESGNSRRRRAASASKSKGRSKPSRAAASQGGGKRPTRPGGQASARVIPFHIPRSHRPRKLRPWRAAEVISL
jgi:hypothetical protein